MECKLDRITVHYEAFGEGRPIVFLHGSPADHSLTVFIYERHFANRKGWKRIYPDLPGHGKTSGPDWIANKDQMLDVLSDFIDKIIPGERFVVEGASYGAYFARGLAYRRGDKMDGLLLSVPTIGGGNPTKYKAPPHVTIRRDHAILNQAKSENIGWFEEAAVVDSPQLLELGRVLKTCIRPDEKFLERTKRGFSFDIDNLPQPFPAPTLFLLGRQDNVVGYRNAWEILENYPRATFAVLDRAGHFATVEQSGLCTALVDDWLDRVEEWASTRDNPAQSLGTELSPMAST